MTEPGTTTHRPEAAAASPRRRRWVAFVASGVVLALIAAVALAMLTQRGAPASARWRTAQAERATITQSWATAGAVKRVNQVDASFATPGTVTAVDVKVGDPVTAGQRLARIDPTDANLAVVQAQADLAQARAQLDAADEGGGAGSAQIAAAQEQARALTQMQAQLRALTGQVKALAAQAEMLRRQAGASAAQLQAVMAEQQRLLTGLTGTLASPDCVALLDWSHTPASTGAPVPTASPSGTPSAAPSTSATATETSTPSATPTPTPSATPTVTPTPSTSATPSVLTPPTTPTQGVPLGLIGPTRAQVAGCLDPLQALARPSAPGRPTPTGRVPTRQASAPAPQAPRASAGGAKVTPAASGSGGSAQGGSSEARVAQARVQVLQAQQALARAQDTLADATLTAPIAGTVGALTMTEGASSAGRAVTIIGTGGAQITIQVPLSVRPLMQVGLSATASPLGSAATAPGTITRISPLATAGTSGNTSTYAATIVVDDPDGLLYSGTAAIATIDLGTIEGVLSVPASAVRPTGRETGTINVLPRDSDEPRLIDVTLGVRGEGRVQVLSGVNDGDLVVLADLTAAVPANSNQQQGNTGPNARPSTGAPRPTASPSR